MADFITIYPLSIGDLIQTIKHKRYTSATLYFMDTKVSGRFFSTVCSVIPCSFDKENKFWPRNPLWIQSSNDDKVRNLSLTSVLV